MNRKVAEEVRDRIFRTEDGGFRVFVCVARFGEAFSAS